MDLSKLAREYARAYKYEDAMDEDSAMALLEELEPLFKFFDRQKRLYNRFCNELSRTQLFIWVQRNYK